LEPYILIRVATLLEDIGGETLNIQLIYVQRFSSLHITSKLHPTISSSKVKYT